MSATSLFYWQDQYMKAVPRVSRFVWNITGTTTASLITPQSAAYGSFGAISQAIIDGFYGSTNEILTDKYDATSMGVGAFGVLLNFGGQVNQLVLVEAYNSSGTGGVTQVSRVFQAGSLTASTLESAAVLTTPGNIGIKLLMTGLDSVASGQLIVDVSWISK